MLTSRDFQRAAQQRLTTAEFLLDHDFPLDAFYLAGYAVECMIKSLILHLTSEIDRAETFERLRQGSRMHYPEHLKAELRALGCELPLDLTRRFRRFEWSTDLRYESGRWPMGEVRGYLKTARLTFDWARGAMP